jgi:hypothetical protein
MQPMRTAEGSAVEEHFSMPRLPKARAKSTASRGIIPCVHNVRKDQRTVCYAIGEMEEYIIHFIDGRSWQPCMKKCEGSDGKCHFCDAHNKPREHAYFPALLETVGKQLTPVVIGVPAESRKAFPKLIAGHVFSLSRTDDKKLRNEILKTMLLPDGVNDLFFVDDVLNYHWFGKIDETIAVPEIPNQRLEKAVNLIRSMESRKQAQAPKAQGPTIEEGIAAAPDKEILDNLKRLTKRIRDVSSPTINYDRRMHELYQDQAVRRGLVEVPELRAHVPEPEPAAEPRSRRFSFIPEEKREAVAEVLAEPIGGIDQALDKLEEFFPPRTTAEELLAQGERRRAEERRRRERPDALPPAEELRLSVECIERSLNVLPKAGAA